MQSPTALSFKIFLRRDTAKNFGTAFHAQKLQGGKLNLLNERAELLREYLRFRTCTSKNFSITCH